MGIKNRGTPGEVVLGVLSYPRNEVIYWIDQNVTPPMTDYSCYTFPRHRKEESFLPEGWELQQLEQQLQ